MRGKVVFVDLFAEFRGITPAHAGKRPRIFLRLFVRWDHPRICGEKFDILPALHFHKGSPPHMRGKEYGNEQKEYKEGITPAYAGKSNRQLAFYPGLEDHPRICGEKPLPWHSLRPQ